MKISLNGTTLDMKTKVLNSFTDGMGLDTMIIVEGKVNNTPITMELDGNKFSSLSEARRFFKQNAWKKAI